MSDIGDEPEGAGEAAEATQRRAGAARHTRAVVQRIVRGLARGAEFAGSSLIDLIYPASCIACGGPAAEPHGLCGPCWRTMPLIERPYCERLGTPFAVEMGPGLLSPAALAEPPVFGRARAVTRYDGPAREMVHRLKFEDRLELGRAMGLWMARAGAELIADADALLPVPLHRIRLWTRRSNQAAVLGGFVGQACGLPLWPDVLRRVKATRSQVGLSRNERALNLQGSFKVPDEARAAIAGRRLVLIDDVLTTGATANAASRVLLRAGARSVDVLTFARVCSAP
jgi:ComF family protein